MDNETREVKRKQLVEELMFLGAQVILAARALRLGTDAEFARAFELALRTMDEVITERAALSLDA